MRLIALNHKVYNEARIIRGCAKGKEMDQYKLFKQYFPYCMKIALRYCTDELEAKAVVNDSFLKVFEKIKGFDNEKHLKPWLSTIVVNTAIDHYRKHRKKSNVISSADNEEIENISDNNPCLEQAMNDMDSILPLIQCLSPQYRIVFNLFVFEDYSHKEIAAKLKIAVGTSKSNYSKAKGILKQQILSDNRFGDIKKKIHG